MPTPTITCNGAALRAAREDAGLSRGDLARRIQVSTSTIWTWEAGRSQPTPERLTRAARTLNVAMQALIKEPDLATLTTLRSSKGIKQDALAQKAGISRSRMSQIERGETPLSSVDEAAIAKALRESRHTIRQHYDNGRYR